MYKFSSLLFLSLWGQLGIGQNLSNNVWCFGDSAEISFSSGAPVSVFGCALNTTEGTATICDSATGQLLFYTDGTNVWNKNNSIMPGNTIPLGGNVSSSQSALIVPVPGSTSRYYIFTTDAQVGWNGGDSSLSYSIIDIALDGGLGDILQQPQELLKPTTEKLTATPMANGQGFWVVTHLWNSNAFYAFPVTTSGIGPPIISQLGSIARNMMAEANTAAIGYMQISPDGHKLAQAVAGEISMVELFHFNNLSGTVSGEIFSISTDPNGESIPYGVCFSPNSKILYISYLSNYGQSRVMQFDLTLPTGQAMIATHDSFSTSSWGGAMQIAPNGKIYCVNDNSVNLDCINNPNVFGPGCNFQQDAFALIHSNGLIGLPNTIHWNIPFKDSMIVVNNSCPDSCLASVTARAFAGHYPYTYYWLGSNQNDSVARNLCPGKYFVVITDDYGKSVVDSAIISSRYVQPVTINANAGTLICANDSTVQWYLDNNAIPGAESSTYDATSYGNYVAMGLDSNGCAFTQYVKYANADYFFPNVFTPDGNGVNDFFYPMLGGDVTLATFQIFNRWGELLYDNVTAGWDGKFKGVLQPEGVYVYYAVLQISSINGAGQSTLVKREGSFTLLR